MKGLSGYEFTADGQAALYVRLLEDAEVWERKEEFLLQAFRNSTRWGFRPKHIEQIIEAYEN